MDDGLTPEQEILALKEEQHFRAARESLIYFAETIEIPATPPMRESFASTYPVHTKPAAHHRLILQSYEDMLTGKLAVDGIVVMAPPGSAKSSYASVVCPAWTVGRFPGHNIMVVSYSSPLATQWGYRIRQVVKQDVYGEIFPDAQLQSDQSAVGKWSLSNHSSVLSDGINGSLTGFRADVVIADDLIKGREESDSELIRNNIWRAVNGDLLTRLKPGAKLLFIGTRWVEDDPIGRILGEDWKGQSGVWKGTDGRTWLVINLPMLAEHKDDPLGRKSRQMLWPEWFRKVEIDRLEAKGGRDWSALYQQRPAANEGSILVRSWWREWKQKKPPECEYIFLAYDTAIEADESNDFSAMTAWGIFKAPADDPRMDKRIIRAGAECYHAILIGAWQDRIPAVDLFAKIKEHITLSWPDVDMILVEKKGSGAQLVQEMKRMRWPVKAVEPKITGAGGRQKGKVPRANSISHVLAQGAVWYIAGAFTNRVLDECTAFPHGRHDDLVDTVLYALEYFRNGFFFTIPSDFEDQPEAERNDVERYRTMREQRKRASYGGGSYEEQTPLVSLQDSVGRGYGRD